MSNAFVIIGSLFFLGHGLKWVFQKTKVPDLLLLVAIGAILGPIGHWVSPADLGKVGPFLAELALVVILFEGGMGLQLKVLKEASLPALKVTFLGFFLFVPLTALLVGATTGLSWGLSLFTGIALGSTSSAIVIPMVRFLSVQERTRVVLMLESAINDILVIVGALVVVEVLASGSLSVSQVLTTLGPVTLASIVTGSLAALGFALLRRYAPPLSRIRFSTEVLVCMVYGLTGLLQMNGALAVLSMGLTLGNLNILPISFQTHIDREGVLAQDERALIAELAFLLKVFFFIYLGVLLRWDNPWLMATALGVTVLVYLTRYGVARVCRSPQDPRVDTLAVFSMGPRGLAAAVVAGLPAQKALVGAEAVQSLVFSTIPFTILATAVLVFLTERFPQSIPFLKVGAPEGPTPPTPATPPLAPFVVPPLADAPPDNPDETPKPSE